MASANQFLARFGFREDPFEHVDAEQEPQLDEYFVPPPYFANVMGDARYPRSHLILAPRGGGKTAQRRMIEAESERAGNFLCVSYDAFDQPSGFGSDDADLAYHLNQICRRVLVGVLVQLDLDPELSKSVSEHQRQLLKFQIDRFLGSLTEVEMRKAVGSLKNFGDMSREFVAKYAGPLKAFASVLMSKIGIDNIQVPAQMLEEAKRDEALGYHFENLLEIAKAIGFQSTYILVDRVDEMPITDTAGKTFAFIWPVLADLHTLEAPGVAFKLFLWDEIAAAIDESNFRRDRIEIERLKWSQAELSDMLAKRLETYSEGAVTSVNQMVQVGSGFDVHALISYFAHGSPRDMYRLARGIVAEQTRTSDDADRINAEAVWAGIRRFSEVRASELMSQAYIDELRRIGAPTFTNAHIASNVFRIHENNARRKIQLWEGTGLVKKIDEIPTPGTRPRYLYGVVDPRLAIAILPTTEVDLILDTQILLCSACGEVCITDEAVVTCIGCSTRTGVDRAQSLLDGVSFRRP
ncbi:MAG TPA: hypothetical protein VHP56_13440 [Solirubrobacterales bacterium]|jgi:predicted XRE-type DNA-binding protein|nr:hypothetical protein [Solirubrobacterales bacterium]